MRLQTQVKPVLEEESCYIVQGRGVPAKGPALTRSCWWALPQGAAERSHSLPHLPPRPRTAWSSCLSPPDTNRYSQRPQGRFCLYFPETAWGWGGWQAWLGYRIRSCRAGLCSPPPGPACLLSVLMPRAGCQEAGSISDQLHTSRDSGCLTWSMWRLSLWNLY